MTRLLSLSLAVVVALSVSACKRAHASGAAGGDAATSGPAATAGANACSVVGVFGGRVRTSHGPGTSVMTTGADGSFSIAVTLDANQATTTLKGRYTTSGNQISFVNDSGTTSNGGHIMACIGVRGVYAMAWSPDCKRITLSKVSDSCPPREQEAGGTTLTRQ